MADFKPSDKHIGKPVYLVKDTEVEVPIGKLDEVKGPHCFVVDGVEWEVDSVNDFQASAKSVTLFDAWKD